MIYPSIDAYLAAMQGHRTTVLDPLLAAGSVEMDSWGAPRARSGTFALTFKITAQRRHYAFRCFQKERKSMHERYGAIHRSLRRRSLPYFVDFAYLDEGIRVNGRTYPALRMDWAEGQPLGTYIESNLKKPARLRELQSQIDAMAVALEEAGIAHGDIQTGNLLVDGTGQVLLVDYDGMFVPSLSTQKSLETGHRNFQHPQRERVKPFDPTLDRFAFALLHCSLSALIERSTLWNQLGSDPEALLLRATDFTDPVNSTAFSALRQLPASGERFEQLAALCLAPYEQVPTFSNFLARKKTPTPAQLGQAQTRAASTSNQAKLASLRSTSHSSGTQKATSPGKAPRQATVNSGNAGKLAGLSGQGAAPSTSPAYKPAATVASKDRTPIIVAAITLLVCALIALFFWLSAVVGAGVVLSDPSALEGAGSGLSSSQGGSSPAVESEPAVNWRGSCWDEVNVTTREMNVVDCSDPSADFHVTSVVVSETLCPSDWMTSDSNEILCIEPWPVKKFETCVDPEQGDRLCSPGMGWEYQSCWDEASGVVLQQRVKGKWETVKREIARNDNCMEDFPWSVSFQRKATTVGTKEYRLLWPDGFTEGLKVIVSEV